jgi:hypothetical protein
MAAPMGTGFSALTRRLYCELKASDGLTAGRMDNMFYSLDKEHAAIVEYKFKQDGEY